MRTQVTEMRKCVNYSDLLSKCLSWERKTINDGSELAYSIAKDRIREGKKHLKQMFYDKVKVVSEMQGAGTCKSMYYRLRSADKNLQLYEILNADMK